MPRTRHHLRRGEQRRTFRAACPPDVRGAGGSLSGPGPDQTPQRLLRAPRHHLPAWEVRGKRVLDAGCGPGIYAEVLAGRGAGVVGFDASERMVGLAQERLGGGVEFFQASLEERWRRLDGASCDLAVCALAMGHVRYWSGPLSEFRMVLEPGGRLMFSVEHPASTFVHHVYKGGGNYFETEAVGTEWTGFPEKVWMPSYRRLLGDMVSAILRADLIIADLLEPRPDERFREADPEEHGKLSRMPGFLCFGARKPGAA